MDSFLDACGATGLMLLDVARQDGSGTTQRAFQSPFVLIGRGPQADLVLDHDQVSQRHAYLQRIDGRLFWIDLESRTGTIPEEKATGTMGWIDPGQTLQIGPFRISIGKDGLGGAASWPPDWPSPLSSRSASRYPLPEATMEVLSGVSKSKEWPINRVLTLIGRSRLCRFRISGTNASRFYGSLLRTPRGVWLVDLLATERTSVNGERVRCAGLEDGDVVRIGPHELRLRYGAAGASSPSRGIPARVAPAQLGPNGPNSSQTPMAWSNAVAMPLPDRDGSPGHDLQPFLDQMAQMQRQMCDQFQQAMMMMSQMFGSIHRDHMTILREELDQIRRLTQEMHAMREASGGPPSNPAGRPALNDDQAAARAAPPPPMPTDLEGDFLGSPGPAAGERLVRRDPLEVHEMVSNRLAAYERERKRRWNKILRVLMGQPT